MKSQDIEDALSKLTVNKRGQIRGKNQAINKVHSDHLKAMDNELMDIRVFVARLSTGHTTKEVLQMIDEFIYGRQIK